jgi:hypothetical protein
MSEPTTDPPYEPNKLPPLDVSPLRIAEYEEKLNACKSHPDFDSVFSKYRVITDGKSFKVQKRGFLGLWKEVRGSVCCTSIFGVPDGQSAADTRCALIQHVFDDICRIDRERHGWQVVK